VFIALTMISLTDSKYKSSRSGTFSTSAQSSQPIQPHNYEREFVEEAGSDMFASWLLDEREEDTVADDQPVSEKKQPKKKKKPKPFQINRYLDWSEKVSISQSEIKSLLAQRSNDPGPEECSYAVMILDHENEEGEEFLMYAYPTHGAFFQRIVALKSAVHCLEGATASISGQSMRTAVLHDTSDSINNPNQPNMGTILVTTFGLDGWMHGKKTLFIISPSIYQIAVNTIP